MPHLPLRRPHHHLPRRTRRQGQEKGKGDESVPGEAAERFRERGGVQGTRGVAVAGDAGVEVEGVTGTGGC